MLDTLLEKIETRVTEISDQDYLPQNFSFEQVLVGLSALYQKGVEIRLRRFQAGRLKQKKLPCPVISVGNIAAGGTGKTPMAVYLARRLLDMGRKPVVISRGYKGQLGKFPAVVGDGRQVFLDARTAGDEPFMMAGLTAFPVVAGRDRYAAGRFALDHLDVDTVVLDDGFQHVTLSRDLDLVLLDFKRPLGNGRMLPAGRLREPPALCRNRIGALIFTRCPEDLASSDLADRIPEPFRGLPSFAAFHRPVLTLWTGQTNPGLSGLKGRRALLFSGIARNDVFAKTVAGFGVKVMDHLEFKDHYRYKGADFCAIRDRAETLGADMILTTEKDWVKVDQAFAFKRDVGVTGIRMAFQEPDAFDRFLTLKALT